MAQLTLTIPNDKVDIVLESIATRFGYIEDIGTPDNPIPNPVSKVEFARRVLIRFIKDTVKIVKDQEDSITNSIEAENINLS